MCLKIVIRLAGNPMLLSSIPLVYNLKTYKYGPKGQESGEKSSIYVKLVKSYKADYSVDMICLVNYE